MKRFLHSATMVLLAGLLTHCVSSGPRTIHFPTSQIQQKLNTKLAQPIVLMKVFKVQLSNALVSVEQPSAEGAENRLHSVMDMRVTGPLLADTLTGKLDVSGVLKFDDIKQAVVLDEVVLDHIQIAGLEPKLNSLLQSLVNALSQQTLNAFVLYQVQPEALKIGNTYYQPSEFKLHDDGLHILLIPQP